MFAYGGYVGKLARVHLGKKSFREERLDAHLAEKYLGGRGLAARLLFEYVNTNINPLGPENKLIFMTGPLVGTRVPGSDRFVVSFKSPQTGIYGMSLCGGSLGSSLKAAGFDGLIVEEKAEKPVYIMIVDGEVSIRDASHLWGLPTDQTEEAIKEELNGVGEVACIGPAGENLVRYASIINNRKGANRCGPGAVMGSKNLKAIVASGNGDIIVSNVEMLQNVLTEAYKALKEKPYREHFDIYGTMEAMSINNSYGTLPTRNYREGSFEGAEKITGENVRDKFVIKDLGCSTCAIGCKKVTYVKEGPFGGATCEGPDYETLWAFGPQCGNDNFESIVYANMLCDKLGLDTITTGNTIGFAMECYERGFITSEETGGLQLNFGNPQAIIEMIKQIAYRNGIGNLLAKGTRAASKQIGHGSEHFAMNVKGLELAGYDPRGAFGQGLIYAISNRGGCHHSHGNSVKREVTSGTRFEVEGKGKLAMDLGADRIVWDSIMICTFQRASWEPDLVANMMIAVTGRDWKTEELTQAGVRINNTERAFNVREGVNRKDDTLPRRLLKDPLPKGPARGHTVNLKPMLDEYYRVMGWNEKGIPTRETLKRLDCMKIFDELEKTLKPVKV